MSRSSVDRVHGQPRRVQCAPHAPEWQKNQQVTFEVNDLDVYWAELEPKDVPGSFAGVKVRPPTDFPWGREIHIVDPGGVCYSRDDYRGTQDCQDCPR